MTAADLRSPRTRRPSTQERPAWLHYRPSNVGSSRSRHAWPTSRGGYGDPLYKLHRASVKADLRTAKILQRLEIPDISEEEIDAVLDEQ